MKLEFKDGYIEINEDNTLSIIGECALTYYFTLHKTFRKYLKFENIENEILETIKDTIKNGIRL